MELDECIFEIRDERALKNIDYMECIVPISYPGDWVVTYEIQWINHLLMINLAIVFYTVNKNLNI